LPLISHIHLLLLLHTWYTILLPLQETQQDRAQAEERPEGPGTDRHFFLEGRCCVRGAARHAAATLAACLVVSSLRIVGNLLEPLKEHLRNTSFRKQRTVKSPWQRKQAGICGMPSPSSHKGHVTFEVDGSFPRDSGTMGREGGHHRKHLDVDHDAARLAGPDDNMTFGIGVVFVKEPRPPQLRLGGVMEQPKEVAIIKQIVTGGSADREGTLKQGDIIVTVGEFTGVRRQN
jgi:hypothetical protein